MNKSKNEEEKSIPKPKENKNNKNERRNSWNKGPSHPLDPLLKVTLHVVIIRWIGGYGESIVMSILDLLDIVGLIVTG